MTVPYGVAKRINRYVNAGVAYREDIELYQRLEHWAEATTEGDCEDYALAKRRLLRELGYAPNLLRLALCKTDQGVMHAVLIVTTGLGDVVLDNLHVLPMDRDSLGYTWLAILEGGQWHVVEP